ncbi:MAG: glycosyltransferase family protein [Bacillota bacterium]|nr:glycosyltransferase family protein [Bacillota bacterium]
MNVVCIVQARMGSSRLPGKVLMNIRNKTIVELIYERLKKCSKLNKIIFAIPNTEKDKALIDIFNNNNIEYFMGNENDVLERYYFCAKEYNADFIIRVTCDCPFVDYTTIDEIVEEGIKVKCDYILKENLPVGVTSEAFTFEALEKAYFEADKDYQREHVISYFLDNPDKFKLTFINAKGILNKPEYRLTLDTLEDFNVIKTIYDNLYKEEPIDIKDVIEFIENNHEILKINSQIKQKTYKDYL